MRCIRTATRLAPFKTNVGPGGGSMRLRYSLDVGKEFFPAGVITFHIHHDSGIFEYPSISYKYEKTDPFNQIEILHPTHMQDVKDQYQLNVTGTYLNSMGSNYRVYVLLGRKIVLAIGSPLRQKQVLSPEYGMR